ncbi:uncharacterized protein RSE6_12892 [Rhynchosporium secalis]|uniref:Uncharacterized protein n=1 Tax=Rhynchosporium secalis TaxID=38038 RepID=A0A1E1MRI6_RHYSE|nr:uncharacterized protein RSE6_12892 [Rhynchosporium secalis]
MKFQALVCLAFMAVGTIAIAVPPVFKRDQCLYTGPCDPQACGLNYSQDAMALVAVVKRNLPSYPRISTATLTPLGSIRSRFEIIWE